MQKENDILLSVVLYGRNDGYRHNYVQRIQYSLDSLERALDGTKWEIVLIDYNPVKGQPLLSSLLHADQMVPVVISPERHVEFVDRHFNADAHMSYKGNEHKPLKRDHVRNFTFFPGAIFNEGFKETRGRYVLHTSCNNLFPMGFKDILAGLQAGKLYRAPRRHVSDSEVPRQFEFIMNTKELEDQHTDMSFWDKRSSSIMHGSGDFLLMHRDTWAKMGGFVPIPHPRPKFNDAQIIFHCGVYRIPVESLHYVIFNMRQDNAPNTSRKLIARYLNYAVEGKAAKGKPVIYDHLAGFSTCIYKRFQNWGKYPQTPGEVCKFYVLLGKKYRWRLDNYAVHYQRVQEMFRAMLDDTFMIV